ncbi:MAG: BtpA/SgcQ family protein [Candidatus Eisenbacteria bacterium]|nr:BtpA/SgcQ family protein [Candidatus Eisenbacteria bacterium]
MLSSRERSGVGHAAEGPLKLWKRDHPFFAVLHLPPLPGAPGARRTVPQIVEAAAEEARVLLGAGFDGLVIENYGDAPFFATQVPPETIAAMSAVACEIRRLGTFPLGINVLRNDAQAALAVATAARAELIRVNVLAGTMLTDQGLVTGPAASLLRKRKLLGARVAIWADLLVKHAAPLAPTDPLDAARDLSERAGADALILTGRRTGQPVDRRVLEQLHRSLARLPRIVGSGVQAENLADYWADASAFIIGSAFRRGGRPGRALDPDRLHRLMRVRRQLSAGA